MSGIQGKQMRIEKVNAPLKYCQNLLRFTFILQNNNNN